jgi:hypothetical protein
MIPLKKVLAVVTREQVAHMVARGVSPSDSANWEDEVRI